MGKLSTESLLVIYFLMLLGGSTTICLFPLVYRRWTFSRFRRRIESLIADTFAHEITVQIGVESGRPPPNDQTTFREGRDIETEIEEGFQKEDLDFECMDAQDRPGFEALVVSYKRRDR
jgi:chromosomal replication initiation ATPase DnaA